MGDKTETLYKKAPNEKLIGKEFSVKDIKSPKGYKIIVQNNNQRLVDVENGLTKLFAIKKEFPNNIPLNKAIQKRALKIVDLSPEEEQAIMDFEESAAKANLAATAAGAIPGGAEPTPPGGAPAPTPVPAPELAPAMA